NLASMKICHVLHYRKSFCCWKRKAIKRLFSSMPYTTHPRTLYQTKKYVNGNSLVPTCPDPSGFIATGEAPPIL
ncbi:MAG: hypothetical protein ACYSTN_09980, partial [Planctomycetota bacterium]